MRIQGGLSSMSSLVCNKPRRGEELNPFPTLVIVNTIVVDEQPLVVIASREEENNKKKEEGKREKKNMKGK